MDAAYWRRIGQQYEREIFSSSKADKRGAIARRLDELAAPRGTAADFGCGVGHYLPLLAKRFARVHGIDFADSLLEQATERVANFDNVSLHQANLASGRAKIPIPKVRVGVCANVLITDDAAMRRGILRTLARYIAPGGRLLLVVPSLESVLFANQRLIEWNRRLGFSEAESLASGIAPSRDLLNGLVRIDGVRTKHYLREEAGLMLTTGGFTPLSCDRVEYGWETEFENPPRWMKSPGPWDWLWVARRTRAV